jgi:predicted nuclease of predicted toxin-antitoxin system
VPRRFHRVFEDLGLDAEHLAVGPRRGLADEAILEVAEAGGRMVVTFDLDFGRLYLFQHRGRVGVLLMRLSRLTFPAMERRLREFLGKVDLEARGLQRALIVLEPHRHRVLQ